MFPWGIYVLTMHVYVFVRYVGFLPPVQYMNCRLSGLHYCKPGTHDVLKC